MLTAQRLGDKGESRFQELCADAGLICNKSDRDRAGWDFHIDFCQDDTLSVPFDKRPPPLSCYVQVKTVSTDDATVRLKLNMAERLAKELKPAFIFILKVNSDFSFSNAYLIHIQDARLASILKRLRKESASPGERKRINRIDISFSPNADEEVALSGPALREGLQRASGTDMASYVQKKQRQLNELGYDRSPYEAKMSFNIGSRSELEDILLGLRRDVPVTSFETFETRFQIRLPETAAQSGFITIEPSPFSQCRVTFRATGLLPASFIGSIYSVPLGILPESRRLRIVSALTEFDINGVGEDATINFRATPPRSRATIEEWSTYFRVCQTIHLKGSIEIEHPTASTIRFDLANQEYPIQTNFSPALTLCDYLSDVQRYAGMDSNRQYDWQDIFIAKNDIARLRAFIAGEVPSIRFNVATPDGIASKSFARTYIACVFNIGTMAIGYHIMANMYSGTDAGGPHIILSEIVFRQARELDSSHDIERYLEHVKRFENTDSVGWIKSNHS